jgi:hypothetical protein
MIAQTRREVCFKAVMTVVAFVVLTGGAHAASIVQTASFQFQEANTNFGSFQQFNLALGTLTGVEISVSAAGTGPEYFVFNPTDQPITFMLTISGAWRTDAGAVPINSVESMTLPPNLLGQLFGVGSSGIDLSATYLSNLGFWIGTGSIDPFIYAFQLLGGAGLDLQVTADNPNIQLSVDSSFESLIGTETITYLFISSVPEPPSSHMLVTAVLILAGAFLVRSFSGGRCRLESAAGGRSAWRALRS